MTGYAQPEDILQAFSNLTSKQKYILSAVASRHLGGTRFSEPLDLMHEAVLSAVDGRRRWPIGIDFGVFMAMSMRGIASTERKRHEVARAVDAPLEIVLEWSECAAHAHPSAESEALRRQESAGVRELAARACADLDGRDAMAAADPRALLAGMSASEIRDALGLGKEEHRAVRKRVLRKLKNSERF